MYYSNLHCINDSIFLDDDLRLGIIYKILAPDYYLLYVAFWFFDCTFHNIKDR